MAGSCRAALPFLILGLSGLGLRRDLAHRGARLPSVIER
jgi:hypothetical protein